MDFLAFKSNCVISSVEDTRKLEDLKITSKKSSFPTPDGKKLLYKTHVWEDIYTTSYDTMQKVHIIT